MKFEVNITSNVSRVSFNLVSEEFVGSPYSVAFNSLVGGYGTYVDHNTFKLGENKKLISADSWDNNVYNVGTIVIQLLGGATNQSTFKEI